MSSTAREYIIHNQEDSIPANTSQNDYIELCITQIKKDDLPEVLSFTWLIIWLLLIPGLYYWLNDRTLDYLKNIPLNNIGDYLSGVAAPIAFLWLVLGYKQQSKELSINNEMLRLQHEELKNSVAAQLDQANSMKQQIDILVREKFYPKFKLNAFQYSIDDDYIEICLENVANEVDAISTSIISDVMVSIGDNTSDKLTYIYLQTMENIAHDFEIKIKITFNLEIGKTIHQCYFIHYNAYRHNISNGMLPDFKPIQCEGIE